MKSDPAVETALRELDAAIAGSNDDATRARAMLVALGKLWRLGAANRARERLDGVGLDGARIATDGIASIDFEALEASVVEILAKAQHLDLEQEQHEQTASTIVDLLDLRDEVELALRGAELLGQPVPLDVEQRACLAAYEATLRPELWRLVPLNDKRRAQAERIPPKQRGDFWWWCQGSGLPADALDQLGVAAQLLARFPEARGELDRLLRVERALHEHVPAGSARVISLREWIRARRGAPAGAAAEPALAAGFAAGEVLLIDRADFQISWHDPDQLIVDLVADRAAGRLPALVVVERRVELQPVPDAEERYATRLDTSMLGAVGAELRVPLASGEIALPLDATFF